MSLRYWKDHSLFFIIYFVFLCLTFRKEQRKLVKCEKYANTCIKCIYNLHRWISISKIRHDFIKNEKTYRMLDIVEVQGYLINVLFFLESFNFFMFKLQYCVKLKWFLQSYIYFFINHVWFRHTGLIKIQYKRIKRH